MLFWNVFPWLECHRSLSNSQLVPAIAGSLLAASAVPGIVPDGLARLPGMQYQCQVQLGCSQLVVSACSLRVVLLSKID